MSDANRLVKDWDKLQFVAAQLSAGNNAISRAAKRGIKQVGIFLEGAVKDGISNQEWPWPPLNEAYLEEKRRKKLSDNILIATSVLLNSITHQVIRNQYGVFIGPNRKADSGEDVILVGAVMEYGSKARNIPARPYLAPALKKNMQAIRDIINRQLDRAIKSMLKKQAVRA